MSLEALLIDDHDLFREGLKGLLRDCGQVQRFHEARTLCEGLAILKQHEVKLITLDLEPAGTSGCESVAQIKQSAPEARIVVISAQETTDIILSCLTSGAYGYVPKRLARTEAAHALRQVMDGRIYVPTSLHESSEPESARPNARRNFERLSPRLQDVARELSTGATTKLIAYRMGVSQGTVKLHLSAIYRALGCHNRAEAVALLNSLRSDFTGTAPKTGP